MSKRRVVTSLDWLQSAMHGTGWRFPPERRHALREEGRHQRMPPDAVLSGAGVREGEGVVDLGAGTGYLTEPLARLVGVAGRVWAVDVESIMIGELREMVRAGDLQNVEVVQSEEALVPLPSGIADLVVLAFVLHEPPDPLEFLGEVTRLMKPDGRVLLVEWEARPTEHGPPVEHRISRESARAMFGTVGLSAEDLPSPTDDAYIMLAREFRTGESPASHPRASHIPA